MKKIAILTCLKASKICCGASCFNALNGRTQFFESYNEMPVEVVGFFHCNGCDADYDNDLEYKEKIERVVSMKPDALHIGKCTLIKGERCPVIQNMILYFKIHAVNIVEGTH